MGEALFLERNNHLGVQPMALKSDVMTIDSADVRRNTTGSGHCVVDIHERYRPRTRSSDRVIYRVIVCLDTAAEAGRVRLDGFHGARYVEYVDVVELRTCFT